MAFVVYFNVFNALKYIKVNVINLFIWGGFVKCVFGATLRKTVSLYVIPVLFGFLLFFLN